MEETQSLAVKHSEGFDFEVIVGDPNYKQIKRPSTSPVLPNELDNGQIHNELSGHMTDSDGEDTPYDKLKDFNSLRFVEYGKWPKSEI